MREAHVFVEEGPRVLELANLLDILGVAARKMDCAPGGPGGICFDVRQERLFERVVTRRGLVFEWGVVSNEGEASIISYAC